jgi:hypothetical protein
MRHRQCQGIRNLRPSYTCQSKTHETVAQARKRAKDSTSLTVGSRCMSLPRSMRSHSQRVPGSRVMKPWIQTSFAKLGLRQTKQPSTCNMARCHPLGQTCVPRAALPDHIFHDSDRLTGCPWSVLALCTTEFPVPKPASCKYNTHRAMAYMLQHSP